MVDLFATEQQKAVGKELESLLDQGMTLIEARKRLPALSEFYFFPLENLPDNYFAPEMDGKTYFSLANMPKCRNLPIRGIILADGTIHDATLWHREISTWLKYNSVDLTNSLRYTFDPQSKEIVFKEGYDYYDATHENNVFKLTEQWLERHDWIVENPVISITEQQGKTILFLSRSFKLDFERVFQTNHCFGMCDADAYSLSEQKIGYDNDYVLNHLHFDNGADIYC